MANKKMNPKLLWIQFEDVLAPRLGLTVWDRAVYSYLLRHSLVIGKPFWQERFYDFNVYRSGKVKEKLNYMHANPVIRGLVAHPKDWPWSSWSFYFQKGKGLL